MGEMLHKTHSARLDLAKLREQMVQLQSRTAMEMKQVAAEFSKIHSGLRVKQHGMVEMYSRSQNQVHRLLERTLATEALVRTCAVVRSSTERRGAPGVGGLYLVARQNAGGDGEDDYVVEASNAAYGRGGLQTTFRGGNFGFDLAVDVDVASKLPLVLLDEMSRVVETVFGGHRGCLLHLPAFDPARNSGVELESRNTKWMQDIWRLVMAQRHPAAQYNFAVSFVMLHKD